MQLHILVINCGLKEHKMQPNNDTAKTLGTRSARLVVALYDSEREIFSLADVQEILGVPPASARSLLRDLVKRGLVTRLKPGLFQLVPLQLGSERIYVGNPYIVGHELAGGREYYISHSSAMDIHGMVTQPQLVVFLSVLRTRRPLLVHGTQYRFVRIQKKHFFGMKEHWVDKQHKVIVSDLEKTVIDGLKQPEYCGGISEVAKGFWMRHSDIKVDVLIDYALDLGIQAVIKRLGYLLELYNCAEPYMVARLQSLVSRPYSLIEPAFPNEGEHSARWKLRLNVDPNELLSVIRT